MQGHGTDRLSTIIIHGGHQCLFFKISAEVLMPGSAGYEFPHIGQSVFAVDFGLECLRKACLVHDERQQVRNIHCPGI